jgi:hypothetical protein
LTLPQAQRNFLRIARAKMSGSSAKVFESFLKKPLTSVPRSSTNAIVSCIVSTLLNRYCGLKGGILDAR